MSGKSGRSWSSTEPIDIPALAARCCPTDVIGYRHPPMSQLPALGSFRAGQEDQTELADLDLVTVGSTAESTGSRLT